VVDAVSLPARSGQPGPRRTGGSGKREPRITLQIRANLDAIGKLDGVPAGARHAANVIVLNRELDAAKAEVERRQAELDRARGRAATSPPGYAGRSGITSTQVQLTVLERRLQEAIHRRDMLEAVHTQLALITLGRDDLVTYGEMGSVGDGVVDALMGRGPR
jgi:hypothetical protein